MKVLIAIVVGFVAMIVAISFYLSPNNLGDCDMPSPGTCAPADAIVVVSGGDTNARVRHGVSLFKLGWADRLIFSGAAADETGLSNAQAMKLTATRLGVDESFIAIEEFSRSTSENAINTTQYLERNQISRIILVTSSYHQRRALLEFERQVGDQIDVRNSPVPADRQWSAWWWLTPYGWWLAISELIKIAAFYIAPGAY